MLLTLLTAVGCVTLRTVSHPVPQSLSTDELRLAKALAHFAQGLLYEVEGSAYSSNALQQFAEASRLDPSRAAVNTRTAVSALLHNRPDMAVEALERTCLAFPHAVDHQLDLATAYQLAGRNGDAVRVFRRVLEIEPDRQNVRAALVNLLFFQKMDRDALDVLRRGMGHAPEAGNLMALAYAQGARFYQEKNLQRAIPCFEFVLRYAPEHTHELENLIGGLYEEAGEKHTALRYYRRATRDPAPVAQAFVRLALAKFASSPDGALEILTDADRHLPDNAVLLITRGQILAAQGQMPAALAIFDRVVRLTQMTDKPQQKLTEDFYIQYALMLEQAGQSDKSEEIMELCIRSRPTAANALNFLAYTWAEKGLHLEKAMNYVLRALKVEPESGAFMDTLGWIYYRMGRYADATLAIQRASELTPEDPTILEHLGDVLNSLGCPDDASAYWQRSLHADPDRKSALDRLRARGIDPATRKAAVGTKQMPTEIDKAHDKK